MRNTKFSTVDAYLKAVPEPARAALQKLRATIHAVTPDATEAISYGMPSFRLNGGLVAYAPFKDHCSFFPMSTTLLCDYTAELEGFMASAGTLHFTPERPVPAAMVKKLVKARVAQNATKVTKKNATAKKVARKRA